MPFEKPVQKSLSQHKIVRKLRNEEKGLLMQYHSINIEKLQKRMKNKFSNIAYQIRWSVGDDFKIIISTKSNAVESNHSDESDIRRIYMTFLENIFRPKYTDFVRSVRSCSVYRYVVTSAKHFSVANTSMDSVVNVTLNLARRSNTILNRMIRN